MKRVGHTPLKGELVAIMRRLDTNGDKRISFAEFSEALEPMALKIYQKNGDLDRKNYSPSRSHKENSQLDYAYPLKSYPISKA
jgi:hypothetical protein